MLRILNWQTLSKKDKEYTLSRETQSVSVRTCVEDIIKQVQTLGDEALVSLTQKFDGASLNTIEVPQDIILSARIGNQELSAIQKAIKTITVFHQSLLPETTSIDTAEGINIRTLYKPIQRVGLYVPGGNKTPLVSSLLMQAIPARVAGCPVKVLCTPPDSSGSINPHLLVAARLCGIDTIYSIGGAQAIAAMAYGTQTVTKVDKIFGPGNSFVTEAKVLVSTDPLGAAIDMPAGPSEVMILADNQANPAYIAADLLAQAEHGIDSQVLLITDSIDLAECVNQHLKLQFNTLTRQSIMSKSLAKSAIIFTSCLTEQIDIINSYAPEHLIINREDAAYWVDNIHAAGTVFMGAWAAETMGDYVTGSNHVLPTNGFAKNHNGLSTLDFLTRFSVQSITRDGIKNLGPAAIILAQMEGLDAHANAVQIRLNSLEI